MFFMVLYFSSFFVFADLNSREMMIFENCFQQILCHYCE